MVWVVDGPTCVNVVGVLIFDPTQVKVYGLPERVETITPQGELDGTLVAEYTDSEVDAFDVIWPVWVP